uniref:Alpha-2-macroglobulin RAP C-terminal domain-containing protein n=1 Tax=Panagrolaimus sp. ES5 TaxID=591445 RepID=A0AC34EZG5_9BILA
MEKINYIWSKVERSKLDEEKLIKLKSDLQAFDTTYLSHKQDGEHLKRKSTNLKDVDQKLEQVLEKYGLDDALKAFRIKYKYEKSKIYAEENVPNNKVKPTEYKKDRIFSDKRLEKLWNDAKNDDDLVLDELDDFYERLQLLNSKIVAYDELRADHKEHRSNHIEEDEEHDKTALALKQQNREIEQEIVDLKEVLSGVRENPFHEPQARKLWSKLISSKRVASDQLASLKSDIRQYEKYLIRVNHHKKVLQDAKKLSHSEYKDKADEFHNEQISELDQEQEKLERKSKKYETYIVERVNELISREHEEL